MHLARHIGPSAFEPSLTDLLVVLTLNPSEAVILVHADSTMQAEVDRLAANLEILTEGNSTRQQAIELYEKILEEYNGKMQELLW